MLMFNISNIWDKFCVSKKNIVWQKYIYPFILIAVASIFFLNANPFKGETVAPMDLLLKYNGWISQDIDIKTIHPERSDILDAKLPTWIYIKKQIRDVRPPLWNYNNSGGAPGILLFTNSVFTPAFFVFALIKDNAKGFYFSNLINLIIGGLGAFFFLRIFANIYSSLFGSIIFMFCGFNSAWFFWPHINTSIWIPWLLFATLKYLQLKKEHCLVLISVISVMMNLGGFPVVAIYGYICASLMIFIYALNQKNNLIFYIKPFIFIMIAFGITFPFIYPLKEQLSLMNLGYRNGGTGYNLSDFKLFINPFLNGPRVEKTLYVGIIPLFLTMYSFYLFVFKREKDLILKYAVILLILSLIISFSLIHPDIIRLIPTFNINPWHRFNLVISIAITILSAYALHNIIKKLKNKSFVLAIVIFIALISYQIYDQKKLFNSFNNSVTNKSFYPKTPTIEYVGKNISAFQYVLADNSYLISGTLGAYDLPEWYAHNFKTDDEKKILSKIVKDPFASATAALFDSNQINFKSDLIDYLNFKYILCDQNAKSEYIKNDNPMDCHEPAPPIPENELTQIISLKDQIVIDGIELLLATYNENHAPSDVKLVIIKDDKEVAISVINKKKVKDNKWVNFDFKRRISLMPGVYMLRLSLLDNNVDKRLTAWCGGATNENYLNINGNKTSLMFKMKLCKNIDFSKTKYQPLILEDNIIILENKNIKGQAYFLKQLTTEIKPEYNNINVQIPSNNKIIIDYSGDKKGWIVIPMRSYPGWKVFINGSPTTMFKFLGILPAFRVDGSCEITYQYLPTKFIYNFILSLCSLLLLSAAFIKIYKKERN